MIKKYSIYLAAAFLTVASSCSEDLELVVPEPDNITFNEIQMPDRFSHVISDGGFSESGIHFNAVKSGNQLAGGFCVSNRSFRQFAASDSETAIDSMRYSVWTVRPNTTGNYVVGRVNGDDAYFTLDIPAVIDYTLVANTTWSFLSMTYGDTYAAADGGPVANLNVPSGIKGIWHTYVPGGVKKFGDNDYFTLTAIGYRGGSRTGSVSVDLACKKGHNAENPNWNYILNIWRRFDLYELGEVDKVVFHLDSSDKDSNGVMRTPPFFCLDGIVIRK